MMRNWREELVEKPKRKIFSKLRFFILLVFQIFLLPLVFIPSQSVNFVFTKQILFATVVLLAFLRLGFSKLKEGRYELPASPIVISLGAVAAVTMLSALFSGSISQSFFGNGFEVGTAVSNFLTRFLAVFIIPLYFNSKDKIFSGYVMLFAAFAVLALYEILKIHFINFFSFLRVFYGYYFHNDWQMERPL